MHREGCTLFRVSLQNASLALVTRGLKHVNKVVASFGIQIGVKSVAVFAPDQAEFDNRVPFVIQGPPGQLHYLDDTPGLSFSIPGPKVRSRAIRLKQVYHPLVQHKRG